MTKQNRTSPHIDEVEHQGGLTGKCEEVNSQPRLRCNIAALRELYIMKWHQCSRSVMSRKLEARGNC